MYIPECDLVSTSCGAYTAGLECEKKKQHKDPIISCADKKNVDRRRDQSNKEMSSSLCCFIHKLGAGPG